MDSHSRLPSVLLADDSPTQARLFALVLEAANFRVDVAPDGRAALAAARRSPPDLILADVLMPHMDGFGLCRALRRDPSTRTIPVVLHSSTFVDPKDEEFALAVGATCFRRKPTVPADIVAIAREALAAGHACAPEPARDDAFLSGYVDRVTARLQQQVADLAAANARLSEQNAALQQSTAYADLLQMLAMVVIAVNEAATVDQALQMCLDQVCASIGWPVGQLYRRPNDTTLPAPSCAWHVDDSQRYARLRQVAGGTHLLQGIGLPEQVLAGGQPVWIADLATADIAGAAEAAACGLRAAFGVPVPVGDDVVAVLLFYSTTAQGPDGHLLDVMGHIGAQLGRVIERKRTEEALRTSELRFRSVVRSATDGIILSDGNGAIMAWNDGATRIFGYSEAEVVGRPLTLMMPQRYHAAHSRGLDQLRATGEAQFAGTPLELVGVRRDGSEFPLELTLATWQSGGATFFSGIVRDISSRKQHEESQRASALLLQSEQHYRLLAEAIPQIVWTARADGWRDYFNRRWFDFSGLTLEQTEGWGWLDALHPDDRQRAYDRWTAAIATGEVVEIEYRFKSAADGSYRWHLGRAVPLYDSAGKVGKWFGTCTDIDDQKQAEARVRDAQTILELRVEHRTKELTRANRLLTGEIAERMRAVEALAHERSTLALRVEAQTHDLRVANAELERASRLKDEFLASMSHELRTPLNAVLGLSEALQEQVYGPLNDRQLRSLQMVEESGRHLLALINDILDLAKIDAGKVELEIGPVAIEAVCQASLRLIQQAACSKQLTVNWSCDSAVGVVQADERRLKQILVNLLSNAVKFTPAGGTIGLEVAGDPSAERVSLIVSDTGIGIAPADVTRLFQPFVQLDSRLAREYAGTGLGLALVSRMVDLHGGSVVVASEPGVGSRFTVTLPWPAPDDAQPPSQDVPIAPLAAQARHGDAAGAGPSGRTPVVLLAEDNPENIYTVSNYLEVKGYRVEVASTGVDALAQAAVVRPDVILMDMQMPGMDGLEATALLRADVNLATIPIIALTGLAMPGDRSKCIAAGADAYLSKPVGLHELVDTIEVLRHRDR